MIFFRSSKRSIVGLILSFIVISVFAEPKPLEIHYINVGQGASTLIIGPNGTTLLYDFGNVAGRKYILPYLTEKVGLKPHQGIDYAILSHPDKDHFFGYRDVVNKAKGGFDILVANYGPHPNEQGVMLGRFLLEPAKSTTAGPFKPIPLGLPIDLGDGAKAIVIAADGVVLGEEVTTCCSENEPNRLYSHTNKNDRSIALFINYKHFQYILDGDLGSGKETCSEHDTNQRDIQTRVALRLIDLGIMDRDQGVDLLHIAHHGSESSSSWAYYQMVKPEVGIISVGPDQDRRFRHPRVNVVEKVLTCKTKSGTFEAEACNPIDSRANCPTPNNRVPALKALFQTDYGFDAEPATGKTSFQGFVAGDIKIETDGKTNYLVEWTGRTIESNQSQTRSNKPDFGGKCNFQDSKGQCSFQLD